MADDAFGSLLLGSRALELKNWAKYLRDPTSQVANWCLAQVVVRWTMPLKDSDSNRTG